MTELKQPGIAFEPELLSGTLQPTGKLKVNDRAICALALWLLFPYKEGFFKEEKDKAMKQGIHPDYHDITIVMTDGTEIKTRSTYSAPGSRLQLDIDSKTHPAWTGLHRMVNRGGQLAKFNKRFAGLSGTKEAAESGAAAAAEPKIKLTTTADKKKKKA